MSNSDSAVLVLKGYSSCPGGTKLPLRFVTAFFKVNPLVSNSSKSWLTDTGMSLLGISTIRLSGTTARGKKRKFVKRM